MDKNDVTGNKQLNEGATRIASLSSTTKCCATGTCDNITGPGLENTMTVSEKPSQDKHSPAKLKNRFGPIR